MANLSGKVALVTGASRGIGQAISLILGENGATVIGTATSESGADAISRTFQEHKISGKGFALNVTENDQIENLMKSISDEFGSVDILVNNAGITRDNLLMRMKDDEWDDIMNTNLASVYKMSKAVLRGMMKKKSGRIISIASVVGAMGNAGQTNYSAAKAGIMGFTKSLAREVGPRGITVNAIAPGFIKTDMTDALPEEQKEFLANQIPLGRLGTADEIAETAEFFSFGTNDLTQTGLGMSRDDAGSFLAKYKELDILPQNPFASIDARGVGQLVEIGATKGRAARKGIKLGICGEHGGDPSSIDFCHRVGLNYVSCSPFRVPIARLAAAQAAIRNA